MKFGFDEKLELALQKKADYEYLGATKIPQKIIVPDGDWRRFRPELEDQSNKNMDGFHCVSMANNNQGEEFLYARYGEKVNHCDRFLANTSGTVPGRGNSHNNVAYAKYKKGIVDEEDYPFTDTMTIEEFYIYPPKELLDKAMLWFVDYDYMYEKVKREHFKDVLPMGPIQVAVDSTTTKASQFGRADHSVVLDFIDKDDYGCVFDSYPDRPEKYDPDYPFSYGTRHWYEKVVKVKLGEYTMKLVRNPENGRIYFCDSDNRLHHCEAPTDFLEFFGNKAWEGNDWFNLPSEEFATYEEGLSISAKKQNFFDTLFNLFKKFGSKS